MKIEKIHQRLRRLRKKHGLTIKETAAQIGVPETSYREWEYGREITGGHHYVNLARVFGLSVYELLTGERPQADELIADLTGIQNQIELLQARVAGLKDKIHSLF